MTDDGQRVESGDERERGEEPGGSDTVEYDTHIDRWQRPTPPPGRDRGYWVDASNDEMPATGQSRPARRSSPEGETGSSVDLEPGTRTGRDRRRLVRWVIALVVVAGVAIAVTLILTGRTVVPGLSARIYPISYQEDIARVAQKYEQDPYLIAAVVKAESGYDPDVVSRAGAVGLMQLMPDTATWVVAELSLWKGDEDPDLTDPIDNLELGACYLAYLGEMFGDGSLLTLAAYNAGPGTVAEWMEAAGGDAEFGVADIRFPETRSYVERVEHYRLLYMRIHPDVFGLSKVRRLADADRGTGPVSVTGTASGDDPSR